MIDRLKVLDEIKNNGIVGAGGAGFPTHVKYNNQVDTIIVNAAECEPLLHKDKELLKHHFDEILIGLNLVIEITSAKQAFIGIKEKYTDIINSIKDKLSHNISIAPIGDFYPAGDEQVLIYEITNRVVQPGKLPVTVGCIVTNVETLFNVGRSRPLTHKYITVAGIVNNPSTLCVPIGATIEDCLKASGGVTESRFAILEGGPMMGRYIEDLSTPVTKTTGGYIVLPYEHSLLVKYRRKQNHIDLIGKSACDQCSFCTELCPRYLLGHPIQPHVAMRSLGFSVDKNPVIVGTLFCCECNLCTLFSCPEGLDPRNACIENKKKVWKSGLKWESPKDGVNINKMRFGRKIPVKNLIVKLGLHKLVNKGPMVFEQISINQAVLLLKQHIGAPSKPIVSVGENVNEGQVIAKPDEGALGSVIHASINGNISYIDHEKIIIKR